MSEATVVHRQPCISCGRSTAVGTAFFAGRRVIPPAADDTAAESSYLCEECLDQIHAEEAEKRLSDEQLRAKIESGEIAGWNYRGAGPFTGFMTGGDFGTGGFGG